MKRFGETPTGQDGPAATRRDTPAPAKRFGLIGHPIAGSFSPQLFEAAYGGRYAYDLIEGAEFAASWQRFLDGYAGINITAPFKQDAFRAVDVLTDDARRCGAVNLAVKTPAGIVGYNTDVPGVLFAVREALGTPLIPGSTDVIPGLTSSVIPGSTDVIPGSPSSAIPGLTDVIPGLTRNLSDSAGCGAPAAGEPHIQLVDHDPVRRGVHPLGRLRLILRPGPVVLFFDPPVRTAL